MALAAVAWLTHLRIPVKLERSNRGCPDHREGAAVRFCSSLLGGRPIGRTPDSGSGYPGSSPGLPANLLLCIGMQVDPGGVALGGFEGCGDEAHTFDAIFDGGDEH